MIIILPFRISASALSMIYTFHCDELFTIAIKIAIVLRKKYKGQEEYYFASQIMPSVNRRQSCYAVALVLV